MTTRPANVGRGLLVVLSGPSGVGKGTVLRHLLSALGGATASVSVTTRPPRPTEIDGVDYHFVDDDTFDRYADGGELLEWAHYAGARYGTPAAAVDRARAAGRDVLLEIEVQGALQVRAARPDALLVFLRPPTFAELGRRLRARGTETEDAVRERLEVARREIEQADAFDHQVTNADLHACVDEVRRLIEQARAPDAGPVA